MTELMSCRACGATMDRSMMKGFCHECGRQICPNCIRMCEGCLLNFCMEHVKAREVWRDHKPKVFRLCELCSATWAGLNWP